MENTIDKMSLVDLDMAIIAEEGELKKLKGIFRLLEFGIKYSKSKDDVDYLTEGYLLCVNHINDVNSNIGELTSRYNYLLKEDYDLNLLNTLRKETDEGELARKHTNEIEQSLQVEERVT